MENTAKFKIAMEEAGARLDVVCVTHYPDLSRSYLQNLIKSGGITVNGQQVKPRHFVKLDDEIELAIEEDSLTKAANSVPVPIPILFEDRKYVVINKPAGISTHGGAGVSGWTIADWFAERYQSLLPVGESDRSGIAHRLDKDTSGVMILAKDEPTLANFKNQFKNRRVKKQYLALVYGVPGEPDGRITRALARSRRNPTRRTVDPKGKEAITEWKLEKKFGTSFALIRAFPLTGRTHQIRVHLHFIGFPIVGDPLYVFKRQRPPKGVIRQLLHAESLSLTLPGGRPNTFVAPLPDDFQAVIENLKSSDGVRRSR